MSVAPTAMESHSEKSLQSDAVHDSKDKLCCGMQNGQHHVKFAANVNTTNGYYLDSAATTPLLSEQLSDSSEDDGADASEERSCDSPTVSLVLVKNDGGTSVGDETSFRIALQVFFPYLIAGLGMVGAGAVLEIVKVSLTLFLFFVIVIVIFVYIILLLTVLITVYAVSVLT